MVYLAVNTFLFYFIYFESVFLDSDIIICVCDANSWQDYQGYEKLHFRNLS